MRHVSGPFRALLLLTLVAFIVGCVPTKAQQRAKNWVFPKFEVDFNVAPAQVTHDFAPSSKAAMGVISDENGQLLFYSDGVDVWNRTHAKMPNGTNIHPSPDAEAIMESIVIPKPGDVNLFYIFSLSGNGLSYSEVDMSLDGGLGDVTQKGVQLLEVEKYLNEELGQLSATFHANGTDVWLVTRHKSTCFLILITEEGVSNEVLEQTIGPIASHYGDYWDGQVKFSPDGRRLAATLYENKGIVVFDFNNSTGVLSNPIVDDFSEFIPDDAFGMWVGSLEFSSDGTKVFAYDSWNLALYRVDLALFGSGPDAVTKIYSGGGLSHFQLAPDGKIYSLNERNNGSYFLGYIENANGGAHEAEFVVEGIPVDLDANEYWGLTPNFIQNYFFKTDFVVEETCWGDLTKFTITSEYGIDSVMWDFGQGSTSDLRNPEIEYDAPGEYAVTLFAYYAGVADTIQREINIRQVTAFELGENFTACKGEKIVAEPGFGSYSWNTGETTRSAELTVTAWYKLLAKNDLGCPYTDSVFVTVKELPVIDMPDSVNFEEQTSVELDAGDFASYSWSTGESTRMITVSEPGWYSVLVSDADGCENVKSVYVGEPDNSSSADEWVWLHPLPSGYHNLDIHFVDEHHGFIANGYEILRTVDGGVSWSAQLDAAVKRIDFNGHFGYAIGNDDVVYKSTHNGGGWNKIDFPFADDLNALTVIHADTVLITSASHLFVTNDGGNTWEARDFDELEVRNSYFTSALTGHVLCVDGTIAKTTDGGNSWTVTFETDEELSSDFPLTFVNELTGFAGARKMGLLKTTDGGETWTEVGVFANVARNVFFLDESFGYVISQSPYLYKTVNGGQSWQVRKLTGTNDMFFLDAERGFAVGEDGMIARSVDGGEAWSYHAATHSRVWRSAFPTAQTGYMFAESGVFKTSDGGKSWAGLPKRVCKLNCVI